MRPDAAAAHADRARRRQVTRRAHGDETPDGGGGEKHDYVPERARQGGLRAASLCSGIGGLDLAVTAAFGCEPAWFCESDPHCRTVLERHWPGVDVLPDVREIDAGLGPVDVLHAGYPCQPFSFAGKRQGKNDPRHLWPAVRDAIRVLGPRVVVLENVAGHLRLGFDTVLGDLAGLGFSARWGVVRAADVGAPHRRARLFVVAYADGAGPQGPEPAGRCDVSAWGGGAAADADGERREPRSGGRAPGGDHARAEPSERDGDGLVGTAEPGQVDAADAAGGGRVRRPSRQGRGDLADREETDGDEGVEATRDSAVAWGAYEPAVRRWEWITGTAAPPTN